MLFLGGTRSSEDHGDYFRYLLDLLTSPRYPKRKLLGPLSLMYGILRILRRASHLDRRWR